MGTSCAPAIANLYLAYFENKVVPTLKKEGLLLFKRYIDDTFILYKGSKETIPALLQKINNSYPASIKVTWEFNRDRMAFLDIEFLRIYNRLETRLYTKALNKHMYIPFSSAHPVHVKKGFVLAERSRYKMLCSLPEYLQAAEKALRLALVKRGYPSHYLDSWFSKDISNKGQSKKPTDFWTYLPSEYNPVWDNISIRRIQAIFQDSRDPEVQALNPGRIVLSLKRSYNLFDVYNRSNLAILAEEEDLVPPPRESPENPEMNTD